MRGSTRQRRRGGQIPRQLVTRRELRRENHLIENGAKLRPLPHPTDFMAIPWFPLTVQVVGVTTLNFSSTSVTGAISIFVALRAQLALPANTNIDVRLQSIRGWGPLVSMNSVNALQPLRCTFFTLNETPNPTGGTSAPGILEDIISYPDQVSRASLGFVYPKAQQSLSFRSTGAATAPFLSVSSGSGTGNVFYVRLLWRPAIPLATITDDFTHLSLDDH